MKRADVIHDEPGAAMPRHKPELSDLCHICGPVLAERKLRGERITKLHRAFVEFGYTDLTLGETGEAYDAAMRAIPTAAEGIIAMLIRAQLEQAGIVPGVGL